jgi:hypothetical protein
MSRYAVPPQICFHLPLYGWVALIVSTLGIATMCVRALETGEARAKRAERNKKKELRPLAWKISSYGHTIHQRYPTGEVVVSERDLAEQLRKPHNAVATALDLLLREQKVQRAPLRGYWKLNVCRFTTRLSRLADSLFSYRHNGCLFDLCLTTITSASTIASSHV